MNCIQDIKLEPHFISSLQVINKLHAAVVLVTQLCVVKTKTSKGRQMNVYKYSIYSCNKNIITDVIINSHRNTMLQHGKCTHFIHYN